MPNNYKISRTDLIAEYTKILFNREDIEEICNEDYMIVPKDKYIYLVHDLIVLFEKTLAEIRLEV